MSKDAALLTKAEQCVNVMKASLVSTVINLVLLKKEITVRKPVKRLVLMEAVVLMIKAN